MNDTMLFIGIDPGLTGGLAAIYQDRVSLLAMPLAGKEIDANRILGWMPIPNEKYDVIAYVEKTGAMPGQGVVSMFRFGFVTGIIHGILQTLYIPMQLVAPQTWKKVVLVDTDRSKEATVDWCRRTYPKVNLLETPRSKKPHQGMADALAIAHYGKITWKG